MAPSPEVQRAIADLRWQITYVSGATARHNLREAVDRVQVLLAAERPEGRQPEAEKRLPCSAPNCDCKTPGVVCLAPEPQAPVDQPRRARDRYDELANIEQGRGVVDLDEAERQAGDALDELDRLAPLPQAPEPRYTWAEWQAQADAVVDRWVADGSPCPQAPVSDEPGAEQSHSARPLPPKEPA